MMLVFKDCQCCLFLNGTATTEIYTYGHTLSLHAALPISLTWRGRPRLEDGRVDLKKGGLLPVFSAARVAALLHGITARSTPARLEALRAQERSEEHTSELQSLMRISYAVFCLKKKT